MVSFLVAFFGYIQYIVGLATGYSINVELRGNGTDSVTFQDIPYGVTYTITEPEKEGQQTFIELDQQTDPKYINDATAYTRDDDITGKIEKVTDSKTVKNTKEFTPPETGIALETLPYVLILALALMSAAVLVIRKREEY